MAGRRRPPAGPDGTRDAARHGDRPLHGPRRVDHHRHGAADRRARRIPRPVARPDRGVRRRRRDRRRGRALGRRPGEARPVRRRGQVRAALGRLLRLPGGAGAAHPAGARVQAGPPGRPRVGAPRRRPVGLRRRREPGRHADRGRGGDARTDDLGQLRRPRDAGRTARPQADRHHPARGAVVPRRRRVRRVGELAVPGRLRRPRGTRAPPAVLAGRRAAAPDRVPGVDRRDARAVRRPVSGAVLAELLRHRRVPVRPVHELARARLRLRR